MAIISNNNNNNDDKDNPTATTTTTIYTGGRCSMCGKIRPFLEETEIYYQNGDKMRLENLCFDVFNIDNNPSHHNDNCCNHKYFNDLGFTLMVSDWFLKAYNVILSILISSPLLPLQQQSSSSLSSSANNTTATISKLKGESSITFDTAVHVAYTLSLTVRQYLNSVDKKKVPDVLDIKRNPRLWPIRYRLLSDPLLIKVQDEPLTFRWSRKGESEDRGEQK